MFIITNAGACGETFKIQADIREKESAESDKFKCPKCQCKEIKELLPALP